MKNNLLFVALVAIVISGGFLGVRYIKDMTAPVKGAKLAFLVQEKSVNELSKEAHRIAVVTVKDVLPGQLSTKKVNGRDLIYTDVVLHVEKMLKGTSLNEMNLRLPGGTIGSGEDQFTLTVEDIPSVNVGDRLLVFLGKGTDGLFDLPDSSYTIYGGFQGVYKIENDQALNTKGDLPLTALLSEIEAAK